MKTHFILATLLLAVLATALPAAAYDVRAGFSTVQVRDDAFDSFEGHFLSGLWHPFDYGRFDTLRVDVAVAPWKTLDLVFGLSAGQESGDLENLAAELWLLEPSAGVRKTYALGRWFEAHGQLSLSLPYMRMSVDAPQDEKYWAVFPVVTPAVGLTFWPLLEQGRRPLGFTAELGYGTPAPLEFSKHKGVTPGTLDYAGLTYGLYLTMRFDETRAAPRDETPPPAPAPAHTTAPEPLRPAPGPAAAPEPVPPPAPVTGPVDSWPTIETPEPAPE